MHPNEGSAQMTFDDRKGNTRETALREMSESNGSTVSFGDLLGGRSPAERIAFLAGQAPAEPSATPAGPRPRVYRNYTRRLRDK